MASVPTILGDAGHANASQPSMIDTTASNSSRTLAAALRYGHIRTSRGTIERC
jgi:hypothetical protein